MPEDAGDRPATQNQLDEVAAGIEAEILRIREESAKQSDLKALQQDTQRLLAIAIDSAEKGKAYFEKALTHGHILQEHEDKLRDHGRRLTAIDKK